MVFCEQGLIVISAATKHITLWHHTQTKLCHNHDSPVNMTAGVVLKSLAQG
jgi:hypothetical protein